MKIRNVMIPAAACMALCAIAAPVKRNVVDEVAWIVGDEPIFRSEIEDQYAQMRSVRFLFSYIRFFFYSCFHYLMQPPASSFFLQDHTDQA